MALLQYAERYPVGQRQVKMLDETLESATAGLRGEEVFKSVILHLPRFKLILSCGGKELMKELLDPDYIPGSLKHIPQGSIETLSTSNVLAPSSTSSPKTSSRGLPVTPDAHFMEQAKMRGRADTLRRSAGDASEPLAIDAAGLPLPLSSFDEEVEQVAQSMTALPHEAGPSGPTRNIGSSSTSLGLGQGDTPTTEAYQTFMAMAMSMSGNPVTVGNGDYDFGLGGDNAGDFGFGFDINNFSFDTSDFSALLGQPPQGDGQGGSAYGS